VTAGVLRKDIRLRGNEVTVSRIVYVLLGISPASICNLPTFRNHVSVPSSEAGRLLPAFEDGTDTWFRNVGILHIDAREIPKRTYTIFKSWRKLEIYNNNQSFIG